MASAPRAAGRVNVDLEEAVLGLLLPFLATRPDCGGHIDNEPPSVLRSSHYQQLTKAEKSQGKYSGWFEASPPPSPPPPPGAIVDYGCCGRRPSPQESRILRL